MKKMILAVAGVVMSFAFFAGSASAAESWTKCDASQVGPYGTLVRVQLTGCTIPGDAMGGWVTLNTTGTDQMMATMLTAMSLNKPVTVMTDGTTDSGYVIVKSLILSK